MKLTNGEVWNVYAGGTTAPTRSNSYAVQTELGTYRINPIGDARSSELLLGYNSYFVNDQGKLPGGLWQQLGHLTHLYEARNLCQTHFDTNTGHLLKRHQTSQKKWNTNDLDHFKLLHRDTDLG